MTGSISHCRLSLLGLLVVSCLLQGIEGEGCPPEWYPYEHHCYGYRMEPMTWDDAEVDCHTYGQNGHLASFHSERELITVTSFLKSHVKLPCHIWIGLFDRGTGKTRQWRWADLSTFNYAPWGKAAPSNNQTFSEDCVELFAAAGFKKFKNHNCQIAHPYLCKVSRL